MAESIDRRGKKPLKTLLVATSRFPTHFLNRKKPEAFSQILNQAMISQFQFLSGIF